MTSPSSHSTEPFMPPEAQVAETNAQARNAFRINILYFAANAAGVIAFGVYLAWRGWTWQLFAVALLSAVLGAVNVVSAWLARRGRHQLGIQLVIGVSTAAVVLSPLLVAGFGLIAGLAVTLTNLMITTQVLPQKAVNRVLIISIAAGLAAGALDLLSLPTQLVIPAAQIVLTIIGAVLQGGARRLEV